MPVLFQWANVNPGEAQGVFEQAVVSPSGRLLSGSSRAWMKQAVRPIASRALG